MLNIYCPSAEIVVSAEANPVILKMITKLSVNFLNKLSLWYYSFKSEKIRPPFLDSSPSVEIEVAKGTAALGAR